MSSTARVSRNIAKGQQKFKKTAKLMHAGSRIAQKFSKLIDKLLEELALNSQNSKCQGIQQESN